MKRVIIFNGPPRCGKDTAASVLKQKLGNRARVVSFKTPLIRLTAGFYGLTVEDFLTDYDAPLPKGKWHKDKVQSRLHLKSQRSALIHVSENVIKPVFGDAAFGSALAETIDSDNHHDIFIVPDSGFEAEVSPLRQRFDVKVIRIDHPGCTFEGDSRSYLRDPDVIMMNGGTLEEFESTVEHSVC